MNIGEALKQAMEIKGVAVFDETELRPFIGRMPTVSGGGTYEAFERYSRGNRCSIEVMSYHELISNDWEVKQSE